MKRWEQIVRAVHSAKPIEERSGPSSSVRSRKRKPQRKKQETNSSDDNRCRNSFSEDGQLAIGATKKWRNNKEKIDRHVRQNEQRQKGNLAFPLEIKGADVGAVRSDPVATAVNEQEQDGQSGRDDECLATFNAHSVRGKR